MSNTNHQKCQLPNCKNDARFLIVELIGVRIENYVCYTHSKDFAKGYFMIGTRNGLNID